MLTKLFKHWTRQLFDPGAAIKAKYEAFQALLENDKRAHDLMAELEEIYYDQMPVDLNLVEGQYLQFCDAVGSMIADLARICPGKYTALEAVHKKIDDYVRFLLVCTADDTDSPYALNLSHRRSTEEPLVGGKAANLARITRDLKLPGPTGFTITTNAFQRFIAAGDLGSLIAQNLSCLDIRSRASLIDVSNRIRAAIQAARVPTDVAEEVESQLDNLQAPPGPPVRLAVRSSAKGEDSHTSFAGQYQTVLGVAPADLLDAYKQVLASKYSPEALVYRINYGLADREIPMAVLVVGMVDAMASGVMFTGESTAVRQDRLSIHAVWGLGEPLVSGQSVPAVYRVPKAEPLEIVDLLPHRQREQLVVDGPRGVVTRPLTATQLKQVPVVESTVLRLARWGMLLEDHFGQAQDVEWCLDHDHRLHLLQTRPFYREPAHDVRERPVCNFEAVDNAVLVSGGQTAAAGIASGTTVRYTTADDLDDLPDGVVLVTRNIPPEFVAVVNRLHAVVSQDGSFSGHFAAVAREFGIPTIVDLPEALTALPAGIDVTVDAEHGIVYRGIVESMVTSPCARRNLMIDSPFMNRLSAIMGFVSALELLDPAGANFTPGGCRSHHDIIRFVHEKAVAAMFQLSDIRMRKVSGAKTLEIGIPMRFYVLDVGGGFTAMVGDKQTVAMGEVVSRPLRALFKGLTHPDIQWGTFSHYDWAAYDKVVMSGGSISPDAAMFASHAIISYTYANLNLRFGYHFVVLDAVCSREKKDNYILLRFSGGGADINKRRLRAAFLDRILQRLGFDVTRKIDLIDAKWASGEETDTAHALDMVGRLLGATRLMDMYLKNDTMVESHAEAFMQGRYHFSNVDL